MNAFDLKSQPKIGIDFLRFVQYVMKWKKSGKFWFSSTIILRGFFFQQSIKQKDNGIDIVPNSNSHFILTLSVLEVGTTLDLRPLWVSFCCLLFLLFSCLSPCFRQCPVVFQFLLDILFEKLFLERNVRARMMFSSSGENFPLLLQVPMSTSVPEIILVHIQRSRLPKPSR